MQEAAVVIPYYHNNLSVTEQISYEQCKKVLHKFLIVFVVPEGFTVEVKEFPDKWDVVEMPRKYMDGIDSYNQMMLSKEFYKSFESFKYILIYQLDAYVFSDRLLEFCNYEYDYIGAPWIEGKFEIQLAKKKLFYVGNGGFSLRKVASCLQQLSIGVPKQLEYNEDMFWASRDADFKIAPKEIAWQFAFERPIRTLYQLNGERLPFGCHAWMKYDFDFLKQFFIKDGHCRENLDKIVSLQRDAESEYMDLRYLTASKDMVWKCILGNCTVLPETIWIYGAGRYGLLCGYLLHDLNKCQIFCADKDEEKWGKDIWGIPIMPPKDIKRTDETLIIVAMKRSEVIISKFLQEGYSRRNNLLEFRTLVNAINKDLEY